MFGSHPGAGTKRAGQKPDLVQTGMTGFPNRYYLTAPIVGDVATVPRRDAVRVWLVNRVGREREVDYMCGLTIDVAGGQWMG
jgi:hypothetical protein